MALFGTDGVRGIANRELTPELALKLGRAGAKVLGKSNGNNYMVIGRDTRISGQMLEAALISGICSAGMNVLTAGVMSTPGVARLTRELNVNSGVVISASHNPVQDNGIKFFGPNGYKLNDELESEIEKLVKEEDNPGSFPVGAEVGQVESLEDAGDRYLRFLKKAVSPDLKGMKVVVDCANGAVYELAPRLFAELGADVIPIFNSPDGVNINEECGSTKPGALQEAVVQHGADIGLAFDGDADRVIAVDEKGEIIDGDHIMVICAGYLKSQNKLSNNKLVVTVMSNLGLRLAMEESGIEILETKVGDRYVLEELIRTGACFGGEQSGHIIFLEHGTTGDGLLTALYLMKVMEANKTLLSELASQMQKLPQILENVSVNDKETVMKNSTLTEAIREMEQVMQGRGRILVRPSGTESLVRVMIEGEDKEEMQSIVDKLIKVVKEIDSR